MHATKINTYLRLTQFTCNENKYSQTIKLATHGVCNIQYGGSCHRLWKEYKIYDQNIFKKLCGIDINGQQKGNHK